MRLRPTMPSPSRRLALLSRSRASRYSSCSSAEGSGSNPSPYRKHFKKRGGEGGIRTLEAGISRLRDFQSRSFGQLGHLSVRTIFAPFRGQCAWRRGRDSPVEARAIHALAFTAGCPKALLRGVPQGAYSIREWGARLPRSRASRSSSCSSAAGFRSNPSPYRKHFKKRGGEGGIRTLGTVLPVQPLSRRLPSADSATSPDSSEAFLAEGAGFEPAGRRRPAVFKTAAFSRSAIPPQPSIYTRSDRRGGGKKGIHDGRGHG